MSSKKPLLQEIDLTKTQLSLQMSHQKTTLKEFSSYFKDYQGILRSAIEQLVKLTRRTFTCREFENKTIKGIIDNGIIQTLRVSDILGALAEKVSSIEQEVYTTYIDIKSTKDKIMAKCDLLKKERDQLISNKNIEQQQIEQFAIQALSNMQQNIDLAQQSDKRKNDILINQHKLFLKEKLSILDLIKTSFFVYGEYFEHLDQEYPILQKQKSQLKQQSAISITSSVNSSQTNKIVSVVNPKSEVDLLTSHKEKLLQLRKKFSQTHAIKQLPSIIKEQVGIFSPSIPNNMEIAKEFQQQEFYYFTLLLMLRYKSQLQSWPQFIIHTKNKFKINLSQMKQLETFSSLISAEQEPSQLLSIYVSLIKDATNFVKQEQLFATVKSNKSQLQLIKQILLFSLLNGFWVNCILTEAFKMQSDSLHPYQTYFSSIIKDIIFEEKDLSTLNYTQQIEEIQFPLNQCLLELILSVIIESQTVDMDYLPLIYQFSQDVLKLSPAHVGVTLLSLVYQKILQPALRVKTLDIKEAIFTVETLTSELWEVIQREKSINQSDMQKMMKLKNCDKLQRDLLGLMLNFWSQLPSETQFLRAFINLFYILNNIVMEHFSFSTMNELLCQTLQSTGHSFYGMIIKREVFQYNSITNQSMSTISSLLSIISKECLDLKQQYIDKFAEGIQDKLEIQETKLQNLFFKWFMDGVLSELLILIEQIETCQARKLIQDDNNGNAFIVCYLLAQIDDHILPQSILSEVMQKIGTSLEIWFQNSQLNTFQILQTLISKETFVDNDLSFKEQLGQSQTKSVEDFCSILFKSVEALQQVYKLNDQNLFKKLTYSKMETILYQAMLMYLESLEQNVKQRSQIQYQWFPVFIKNKSNYAVDHQKLAQQQVHLALGLMMRICNMNFLQQQFENLKEQLGFNLAEHLVGDFSTKGKLICKYTAQIVVKEIVQINLFNPMHQDLKILNEIQSYQNTSEWSIKQQIDEIKDFFTIFNQKLPTNYYSLFYDQFITSFFESKNLSYFIGLFFSIFDLNKLQNVSQQKYQELLIFELNEIQQFLQKVINGNVLQMRIKQQIVEFKDVACWFGLSNQDLMKMFEQQHLNNSKLKGSALYRIMLLRKSDSKLKEVVKKYSKIYE